MIVTESKLDHAERADIEAWQKETHNRRLKHKPILKGQKKDIIVEFLAAWFRSSRFSYFQYEGEARVALRLMFLGQGHAWQRADDEAHRLISAALHHVGAVRPTWEQGQRDYATAHEFCNWCHGPLDDEAIAHRDRFCCADCAKAALTHRSFEKTYGNDTIGSNAYRIQRREQIPERECKHCNELFRPRSTSINEAANRQYCSTKCWYEARRTLADVGCANPGCTNIFRQRSETHLYCSRRCKVEGCAVILPIRDCAYCKTPFQPKNDQAMYCSPKCNQRTKDARKKAKRHAAKAAASDHPIHQLFDAA